MADSDASSCAASVGEQCRDNGVALQLKLGAIATILAACVVGVCMPLAVRRVPALKPDGNLFFVIKSFAAGVILATAFVHMLPDSFDSLGNPCLAAPWSKFPFAGFISMLAALFTLLIDFWGTSFYQRRSLHAHAHANAHPRHANGPQDPPHLGPPPSGLKSPSSPPLPLLHKGLAATAEAPSDDPHSIVSVHAHASGHTHSLGVHGADTGHSHHLSPHSHAALSDDAESMQLRHRVISQVLEMGIIAHSIIIGISLGTSQSPCTIRPLLAALTFHQFFEGMALGGCIAQAGFKNRAAAVMAFFFSVTTPLGIAIGIGITSRYNENSPTALIVEGVFDSMSAGILVYMSLVDLIATDFLSKKLQNDSMLQLYSYIALFLGAGAMSIIAYWA